MRSSTYLLLSYLLSLIGTSTAYVVANSGLPKHKQIAWLNDMTDNICSTKPGTLSNEMLESTNDLIFAWAQMETMEEAPLKVESLVKRVIDERRAGNMDATMTLEDYNLLLEGWARSKTGSTAAERCEQILIEMQEHSDITPNLDSFKSVLMAWRVSNDPEAAVRAQGVLEYWVDLYTTGRNQLACPDSDCFDIVLQLWARIRGQADATARTEQLVLAMEKLYGATLMERLRPRTTSFNAVLSAWSHSAKPQATKHMLDVLTFMEKHAKLGDTSIEPDIVSYSTCIGGLARLGGSAHKAEELLTKIEEASEGITGMAPDSILYNSVITAWARNTKPGSYRRARSVLDRQMNLHHDIELDEGYSNCKPDVFGYTSVMASCAMEPKEKYKAFQVALATFQQLRHSDNKYGSPNHVTYGTMLKCCARLLSPANPMRRKWSKKIMTMCIEDGCVGDMAMSRFREAALPDVFREIMQGIDKRNLPAEWTVNVVEKKTNNSRRQQKTDRRRAEV